jgi:hypothetical protein
MVSHFFFEKFTKKNVFKFEPTKTFYYICGMENKLIINFKRNKRTVQSLEVPVEMLKEFRHHVSYVHKNMTDGTWTIYITINIK